MKRVCQILVLSLFIASSAFAHPPKAYVDIDPGFFAGGPVAVVNGQRLKLGFWSMSHSGLAEAMKDQPQAYEYALKHENYGKYASVSLWGGLGVAIAYSIVSRDDFKPGIYWSIFGIGFFSSLIHQGAAYIYLNKAINAYNGVETQKTAAPEVFFTPLADGGLLATKFEF